MLDGRDGCACIAGMKTKLLLLCVLAGFSGLVAGCVHTVDGRNEAAVPFMKDKLESRYERSVPQILEAARYVINQNGKLVADNTVNNSLEGRVNQTSVWIKVDQIDAAKPVSQITVQTRTKDRVADLDLAHELDKQVALYLSSH
jgi:hypothetical protein